MRVGACVAAVLGGIALVAWASTTARAGEPAAPRLVGPTQSTFASAHVRSVPAATTVGLVAPARTTATLAAPAGALAPAPVRVAPPEDPNYVPVGVPLGAGVVAVVASIGAVIASRRSDQRAAGMARHPAQRGVGLDPRRARK